MISARDEFDNNTDLKLQNLTLRETAVREAVCGEDTVLRNLSLENSELDTCAELEQFQQQIEKPTEEPVPSSPEALGGGASNPRGLRMVLKTAIMSPLRATPRRKQLRQAPSSRRRRRRRQPKHRDWRLPALALVLGLGALGAVLLGGVALRMSTRRS